MIVTLVHHADAVSPAIDTQRPLSALGREQAARLASEARSRGIVPAEIWHSGKLRARQTAEPFLALNPFATFKMVRGLLPDDPPAIVRDALLGDMRDLILVGHMPNIASIAMTLSRDSAPLPLHGLVVLESDDGVNWTERWRLE